MCEKARAELKRRSGTEEDCPHVTIELINEATGIESRCSTLLTNIRSCTQPQQLERHQSEYEELDGVAQKLANKVELQVHA